MAKVLKEVEYFKLITLIYKTAVYNKNKAIILAKYTICQLEKYHFNKIYIDKLILDLNIQDEHIKIRNYAHTRTLTEIENNFNPFEIINFKSLIWDILRNGYYE